MPKQSAPVSDSSLPPTEHWQAPLAWVGSPPRPVENYSREFPAEASFVRGEAILTISESLGPGMTRQSVRAVPALIRLDRAKPSEISFIGIDGKCWTYRRERVGRKLRWGLSVGAEFASGEPVDPSSAAAEIERIVVQSVLPMAGTGKYVSFAICHDGGHEDFARATDPDSDD